MVFLSKTNPPPPRKSSRSHGAIPRSKSKKLWMIPIPPCDPNVLLFHPLVSKIWARTVSEWGLTSCRQPRPSSRREYDQRGTFFDNNWPSSWMCHSDRTWYTPHYKEAILSISMQFFHMPERYQRVLVRWHYAKIKGRVELKIETNQSKDL